MWVVKLGGSLADSRGDLENWLERLADLGSPLVIVPGGGAFADQVRTAQATFGFDDISAHRMALLAMEQMAQMLCALHPAYDCVDELASIKRTLDRQRVPVWLPSRMVFDDPSIVQDWSITSDSLAAWLAGRQGARALLLVKSASLPHGSVDIGDLQRRGLLDAAFQQYARAFGGPVWLMHRSHSDDLPTLLDGTPALALQASA